MAQIHALLLLAHEPLSAEDIMEELQISRGNANMNIRALVDWGLVHKELKSGERKEFFVAEKDMWLVVKKIIIQRKKKGTRAYDQSFGRNVWNSNQRSRE
jgi:DNA-binding transcriptional regulator GbsR (MarR family)